ncbi:UNVERIFIED_CONTAM: hypothetical protein Sradi_0644300 [Sesamum radiatum]|uniref:Uncharacterized protein n=1 Tax=Sesamum radiatum TaxID=300843 RepID=A0AAW2VLT9_SESRA
MEAVRDSGAKYECLLFDMDDTLYPLSLGINVACRKNIEGTILAYYQLLIYVAHLQIEETEVPRMCLDLYKEYGTTMAGLKALGYEFDNDEFHAYVHGRLPYELLKPDPLLRNLLLSMPQQKIVGRSTLVPGADHALNSIHNIREALSEIWEDEGEHLEQIIQSPVVETVVRA